jgi:hypothetical protein
MSLTADLLRKGRSLTGLHLKQNCRESGCCVAHLSLLPEPGMDDCLRCPLLGVPLNSCRGLRVLPCNQLSILVNALLASKSHDTTID